MEEISRDYNPNWMTAVKLIDDDNFIGAENSDNIFFCQKNSASADEDERSSLKGTGYFHTGEMINCFVEGSLVMSVLGESSIQPKATFLFGSTMGHVGLGMIHTLYLQPPDFLIFYNYFQWQFYLNTFGDFYTNSKVVLEKLSKELVEWITRHGDGSKTRLEAKMLLALLMAILSNFSS